MRYIPCYAIEENNKYIPYWKLDYIKDEDGEGYTYKDSYKTHYSLIECLYDLKTKKVVLGIIKDIYEKPRFEIGKQVLVEIENSKYKIDTIKEITYKEYESTCIKVKELDDYHIKWYFTEEEIKEIKINELYEIRIWKTQYLMNSGKTIKYDFKLKELIDESL